jgi:hypothetical protein
LTRNVAGRSELARIGRRNRSHHFDADTALEPAGELAWRAWAPDHWFVGRGPNGGFLAAIAARAAEAAAGRPLRSLSLHFVAAPAVGPLDVAATLEREGGSYSGASVRIERDGRPMTLGLATLGELPDAGAEWNATAMPEAKPLAETRPMPVEDAGIPAFMRRRRARLRRVDPHDRAARARRSAGRGDD